VNYFEFCWLRIWNLNAALIVRTLEKSGFVVQSERVEAAEPMREALARQDWEVVIADYQLPQFDALEALRIKNEWAREVPFIVVSGTIGEERAVEMMRAGAEDYVLKDGLFRLAPAVKREIEEAKYRRDNRREHRRVKDRLRDRDDWLALAVGVTQLGMFDFYPQSGRLVLSEFGCRHVGLPREEEVSYETFNSAFHPDDRECVENLIRKAFDPKNGGDYIAIYRTIGITDQVERWLAAQGKVFFDQENKPIRFVGVTMDITQRKELEEQLLQTQKLEGIGMLAGGIAHDFNNLLTIISGFSQMMLDDLPRYHPSRFKVEQVIKSAGRAADLTRQLLAFSRNQPSHTQTILLNDLVANAKSMLGRLIGENIDFSISLDPAVGAIHADAGRIDQVIMNLVINAKDAMPDGGKLTIETANRVVDETFAEVYADLTPGSYATIMVSDTGVGMSAKVKARIFDPFFTTKGPGKGTGLGLSTVYGIVKQCGGSILVSSELGHGTSFTVYLPAAVGEHVQADVPFLVASPSGTETILLAEDEDGVRTFVRASLEQHGYRVLECSNGSTAVQEARQNPDPIHLLLSDVVMPDMKGTALAAQFALLRPSVPVLYMSGHWGSTSSESVADELWLQKPFTPAVLLTRVRSILDKAGITKASGLVGRAGG
jgi:two-component system, cell cycle sensor histidine kinase and response regulator CckA